MTANTTLIHAIAHALIGEYGEEATGWLEDGGRANVERIVAEWRTAIEEGRWIERIEDVLVLRALRHETHWVEVLGGPDAEALIRELADEDCLRLRQRAAHDCQRLPPHRPPLNRRGGSPPPASPASIPRTWMQQDWPFRTARGGLGSHTPRSRLRVRAVRAFGVSSRALPAPLGASFLLERACNAPTPPLSVSRHRRAALVAHGYTSD